MPTDITMFRLESEAEGRDALQALRAGFRLRDDAESRDRRTFLDTFEWRLFRDGGALCFRNVRGRTELVWKALSGALLYRWPAERKPDFAWDLPPGPLQERVEACIDMRRLLPRVHVEVQRQALRLLDTREKTVARVFLEARFAREPRRGARRHPLPWTLTVVPLRGYAGNASEIVRFVEDRLKLARLDRTELALALSAIGLTPGDVPAKQRYELSPEMPAEQALKSILRALLATMRRNEDGVRRDLDTEFLHDFRVAVRRTRSALVAVPGVLPRGATERFRRGFSWLGQVTGPLRDLDVYLLNLPEYEALLLEPGGLAPLRDLLERDRRKAHRSVVRAFDSQRYRRLLPAWEQFLDQPTAERTRLPNAKLPAADVAGKRIWRSYKRVIKRGRRIEPDSPPGLLHRLRIECKRLRYLLEFFSGLFPQTDTRRLIKALKKLQDNLGTINDMVVQAEMLEQIEPRVSSPDRADAVAALHVLRQRLGERRTAERERFHARFAAFADPRIKKLFREVRTTPEELPSS